MSKTPETILKLIEIFEQNLDNFKNQTYNEAQVRQQFINPFFAALGWDMENKAGVAPAYRDVIYEDAIKVGGATKAPDYCFRIGGTRKFFVEAKKPSVNISSDISPAYQLRRYAWSAKLPLSILTDFEEFAVYDCQIRPNVNDKPSVGRILFFNYKDYADKWQQIADIFSKEAVYKGAFDKFAAAKTKKGTTTVDREFLAEIEDWRNELAKNIAIRNEKLPVDDLNFAVQKTIDRILFLRICEDRGIERSEQLLGLIGGSRIYPRLFELFERADERYNSGIFHFRREKDRPESPDELSANLKVDDDVLKKIIKNLYYPCPYEFSIMPAEILGNVYEQFLGKVIRLTASHQAKVEEKPEVKKAGGVYYTPSYIVDYIVKNTVGKLCEGKTPKQIERIKILDPACGSGSFLIGAYQYLLDWHRDWYIGEGRSEKVEGRRKKFESSDLKFENEIAASSRSGTPRNDTPATGAGAKQRYKQVYQGKGGLWFLTIEEKKRILLNNIFGVDIDLQAVEVTKLSLLLKVLENETSESLRLFHERALPDLGDNIKCGNSLIGPDFYEKQQLELFDDNQQRKINVFDWQKEFSTVFKQGGFDAVIGNPPYIRVRIFKELYPDQAAYLETNYRCATHVWDIYLLFFEKALSLISEKGFASFIIPVQTLHQPNCESLRRLLVEETTITQIINLSKIKVFQDAIVKNCILVVGKHKNPKNMMAILEPTSSMDLLKIHFDRKWPQKEITIRTNYSMKTDLLSVKRLLCDKIDKVSVPLEDLFYVTFGLRSCAKGKGQGGKERLITTIKNNKNCKPYLEGRDIKKYSTFPTGRFVKYIPEEMYSPRKPKLFETKKIISQTMLSKMKLIASLDKDSYYVEQSLLCIIPHGILTPSKNKYIPKLEYVLGILNSKLATFYFATKIIDFSLGGGLIHATPGSQGKIPIFQILKEKKSDNINHDKMVSLVDEMLELHKKINTIKNPNEKTRVQRQIEATDDRIDKLVYELYGLTDEEIKIVEGQ